MSFIKCSEEMEVFQARTASATTCSDSQDRTKGAVHVTVGPFEVDFEMTPIQRSIMARMAHVYDDDMVRCVLRPILEQHKDAPSIRAIDWCLTNYAKSHRVMCVQSNGEKANIYLAYKTALNFYRRRNFDAFRRKLRVTIRSPEHGDLTTTIAQLNFYYWAHTTGVLQYCRAHIHTIEHDMNRVATQTKSFKSLKRPGDRRRSELTKPCKSKVCIYEAK